MINRICKLPQPRSFFLFGPRQTGKSTLVRSLFSDQMWEVDLLQTDQHLKYSKFPELLRREALEYIQRHQVPRIFIDEVQRIPALLNEVHFLIEKTACQFLLTGSSARKIRHGGANLLAGRAVTRHLYPFVYQEIAETFRLDDALQFGTLPGVYGRTAEEKIDILRSYTETYLREEIQAESLTRNLGGFSRFLDVAAAQSGELVSFTAVGRECQVPTRTVQGYYQILEDTLVGFMLRPWGKSLRRRLVAHPKFYFFDLGVTNSLNRQLTAPPDTVRKGRLFEQFIILETYRLLNYLQSEAQLFFWRTNHGAEIDLVIEKHGRLTGAFEIKSVVHVAGPHLGGLRSFHEEYPYTPLHLIALAEHPYRIGDVQVMPWKEYLERLAEDFL